MVLAAVNGSANQILHDADKPGPDDWRRPWRFRIFSCGTSRRGGPSGCHPAAVLDLAFLRRFQEEVTEPAGEDVDLFELLEGEEVGPDLEGDVLVG